jgi:hypothetical protein
MRNTCRPDVDAGFLSGCRQRLNGHLSTRDAGIPPVCLVANGDRLGDAVERAMQPEADPADLRQAQHRPVHHRTAMRADLRLGKAVIAVLTLVPWVAGSRTGLPTAEEGGTRSVETIQDVLQDLRVTSWYSGRTCLMAGSCADCMAKFTETPHRSHAALRSCRPAL